MVLGNGPDLVLVDKARWDTDKIKAQLAEIRGEGKVPLKAPEYEAVHAMADAIRANKDAAQLLEQGAGEAEVSGFWKDPETGVWCRMRADYLIIRDGRRPVIVDYKSCTSADPELLAKDAAKFGYHVQAAWYRDGVQHLTGADPVFVFVAQEKTAPYLVTTFYLDQESLREGHQRAAAARRKYAECTATGVWPGHVEDLTVISLPHWAITEEYA